MTKCITFGIWNQFYKYLCFYSGANFLSQYILEDLLVKQSKFQLLSSFPPHLIIQEMFNYLGTFFFALIIIKYDKYSKDKKEKNQNGITQRLIYVEYEKNKNINFINYLLFVALIVICNELRMLFYSFNLKGLAFSSFELLFISIISFKMFKVPIYIHKKVAIYFILISSTLMKVISLAMIHSEDEIEVYQKKNYKKSLIPIGIISFLLIFLLKDFLFCKTKWYFDVKFVRLNNYFLIYGFLGLVICGIMSLITNFFNCNKIIKSEYISDFCRRTSDNKTFFYDKYSLYFKTEMNIFLFTFIFCLKIILSVCSKFYAILIIEKLGPEYIVCANSIEFTIGGLIDFLLYLIKRNGKSKYKFLGMTLGIFNIIGAMIYLEFIELNFCNLNKNLKSNIEKRAHEDIKLIKFSFLRDENDNRIDQENDNDTDNDNEDSEQDSQTN